MKLLLPRLRHLLILAVMTLLLIFPPLLNPIASADNHNPLDIQQPQKNRTTTKDSTSSDLSDIPNLGQMDYDTFEEHIGDIPNDRKPLFNTDNPKLQIKDKTPGSDKTITTEDLKDD